VSPQLLSAQRGIAGSPSPIPTPDGATAFRSHAESQCTVSIYVSNATEEEDAKDASKAMTQRMAQHGTDKRSILECDVAKGVGAERSSAECQTDADCMAEVDSECQGMLRCQPAESNGMHLMLMFQSHITITYHHQISPAALSHHSCCVLLAPLQYVTIATVEC